MKRRIWLSLALLAGLFILAAGYLMRVIQKPALDITGMQAPEPGERTLAQADTIAPLWGGLPPPPADESCSKDEPTPCPEMKIKDFTSRGWMGDDGPAEKKNFLIQSETEWKKTWSQISKNPAPKLDFEKEMAAVVFAGELPGYTLAIQGSEEMPEGKLIIYYRLTPPNPMVKTRTGNFPYAIRTFAKSDLPVEFQEQ